MLQNASATNVLGPTVPPAGLAISRAGQQRQHCLGGSWDATLRRPPTDRRPPTPPTEAAHQGRPPRPPAHAAYRRHLATPPANRRALPDRARAGRRPTRCRRGQAPTGPVEQSDVSRGTRWTGRGCRFMRRTDRSAAMCAVAARRCGWPTGRGHLSSDRTCDPDASRAGGRAVVQPVGSVGRLEWSGQTWACIASKRAASGERPPALSARNRCSSSPVAARRWPLAGGPGGSGFGRDGQHPVHAFQVTLCTLRSARGRRTALNLPCRPTPTKSWSTRWRRRIAAPGHVPLHPHDVAPRAARQELPVSESVSTIERPRPVTTNRPGAAAHAARSRGRVIGQRTVFTDAPSRGAARGTDDGMTHHPGRAAFINRPSSAAQLA